MLEHASDIVPLLLWMIVAVGAGLIALLVYIGQRMDRKVENLPAQVSAQVAKVHDEIVGQMTVMNATHGRLERDVREQITEIDRRVVRLETRIDYQEGRGQRGSSG